MQFDWSIETKKVNSLANRDKETVINNIYIF